MARIIWSLALACALLIVTPLAPAEEIRDYYAEPGLNPFKETVNQHFSEHVDPFSGTLQLKYTDLLIPGNGGMDINVRRVYTSLQTNQYPTLGLNGLGWTMHFGRIVISRNHISKLCTQSAFPLNTKENPSLERPDGGRELLVLNGITGDTTMITRSNWRAQCLSTGAGMLVTSPEGVKYTMDQFDSFQGEPSWLTTRIEDLHGNWIRIDYQVNSAGVSYIDAIYRSEEGATTPVVQYEYESPNTADIKLVAITANGQRVEYRYEPIPGYLFPYYEQLVEVTRPDGRSWNYTYNPKLSDPDPDDDVIEDGLASYSLVQVEYPHGATIDYTYQHVQFDPSSMERTTSIHTKQVSGSGVTGGLWRYTFAPYSSPYNDSSGGQLRYDVTTVTGPDDIQKFYHYGKDVRPDPVLGFVFIYPEFVGTLSWKEVYSRNNVLIERTGYTWQRRKISDEDFWHGSGYRSWWTSTATYVPLLTAEYTNRDSHVTSSGFYHYVQYSNHDAYGNPRRILKGSALTDRPGVEREITYFIDPVKWIVHLAEDEVLWERTSSALTQIGEIERTFDANGKLLEQTVFGVETEYTYTAQGDLASIEDARGNTREFSNYKRGIPRREEMPESVTIEREVNDTGTVAAETNGRGFTTRFDYDDLNRLTSIDFPINGDVSINYASAAGGYRRTLTRGNHRQVDVINDFEQTTRVERADTLGGQMIYRTMEYDASGRQTFTSHPNSSAGIRKTYDALGRMTRMEHPDGTSVNYSHDDMYVDITNERGYVTEHVYHTPGVDFDKQSLAYIGAPQNVGTILRKDGLDQLTLVWQGERLANGDVRGYGRQYEYDSRQFLISITEPELGVTTFTHDAVGNVLSERVNDAEPVGFTYDDLNRRTHADFPGATLDVTTSYDHNNNIVSVTKGGVQWTYGYDENDNLLTETLAIADPLFGSRSYVVSNAYDIHDVLRQITYPSGLVVDYAPDGLGRATRAGAFADNVAHHPNGQVQSYHLGNGVTTNVSLNQRLFTQHIGVGSLVDLTYTYDAAGNVTSIVDGVDATRSVSMTSPSAYDGLDRLRSANGSWGAATFTYDYLSNLTTKNVGVERLNHQLDDRRRLFHVRQLDPNNTSVERARLRMDFDSRGNVVSRRRYALDASRAVTSIDDKRFVYDAASNLVQAQVTSQSPTQIIPVIDKSYVYDGNGFRVLEKRARSYDIRYSVYSREGGLLFEDSISNCTTTDYIRLGAVTLARSDDRRVDSALDTDGDQIDDCMESQLGLNPNDPSDAAADRDGDGLSNLQELLAGTSLSALDTDGDGLLDSQEINQHLTDPTLADSDGDGIDDGVEAGDSRLDPALADADHDGASDYWELQLATNPQDPLDARIDSDGDGFSNRQESMLSQDPTSALKTPERGRQLWRFETLDKIYAAGAVGPDGTLYVSAQTANLHAMNPDGTRRWRYSVPGAALSSPTIGPAGTVYVVASLSDRDEIHAINPDGSQRWLYVTEEYVSDGVAIGPQGRVYFASYTTVFVQPYYVPYGTWKALDDTGQEVAAAQARFEDDVNFPPTVGVNGDVYLVDGSAGLRAFDEAGASLWTLPGASFAVQSPVVDSLHKIYYSDGAGQTHAVAPDGQLLWTRQAPDNQTRSSVTIGSDDVLYIGAYDSKLYAVSAVDGSTLWEAPTYGTSYTPAIASDGTIYVTTFGGAITAFSPTGTELWRHRTETEVSASPILDQDGTLYFGSRTGQIFAVADNGGGVADTPWPMYRHDAAGTGYTCFDGALFSVAVDTDGDGVDDCSELRHGLDPNDPSDAAFDKDGDGLTNVQEQVRGTNLSVADTDGDGLGDGQEALTLNTNPLAADTDGDFLEDGDEVTYALNPLDGNDALLDTDGDGFSNRAEAWAGTNPTLASSAPTAGTSAPASVAVPDMLWPAQASDGTIYQRRNGLTARDANFNVKWNWPTPLQDKAVLGPDGTIHVITQRVADQQRLVALLPNGAERWSSTTSDYLYEAPVVGSDGAVFIGVNTSDSATDLIRAFDSAGQITWEAPYSGLMPRLLIGGNGEVIAYTSTSGVRAYRADNGQQLWANTNVGDGYQHNELAASVDADGTIYVTNNFALYALRPSDGVSRWTYSGAFGAPLITEEGLILQSCGSPRTLCAISRLGALVWTSPEIPVFETTGITIGDNGTIYVPRFGQVSALNASSGATLWQTPLGTTGWFDFTMLLNDGTLYVSRSGGDGALVVTDSGGLADSPWPTRFRDNKHTRNAQGD